MTKKMLICAGLAGGLLCGVSALAQRAQLSGLVQLAPGRWEVHLRDPRMPAEQICIRDGRQFIQLRHRRHSCEHFVVADRPNDMAIQYSCHGKGYGRTDIHRLSDRFVQIETQGIAEGLPFHFAAEARWLAASCSD